MSVVDISLVLVAWVALAQISMFTRSSSAILLISLSEATRETMMKRMERTMSPIRILLWRLSHTPIPWNHCAMIWPIRIAGGEEE